jgi:LysM repeat protein
LICTDGLTNMLDNEDIISVLKNSSNLNDKVSKLISKANKSGGIDNISIQLVKFHNLGFNDEWEDDNYRPMLTYLRSLLKKRKLVYTLIFLFVLGTSLFMGWYESPEVINTNPDNDNTTVHSSDLIIAYLLKEGDNLSELAERFNTTEELLIRLNPNYENIQTGMHIKIPVRYLHTVEHVDELPLIVAKYRTNVFDIMKANGLCNKNLKIGAELIIPLESKK